jgi:hypothetical protein
MIEDPRTLVRALLAAAGIAPPEAEVESMIAGYPTLRAAADSLYLDEIATFAPAFLASDGDEVGEEGGQRGGPR